MSLPDQVIDALLAAGCTAEQLAMAVKAANAADAERKADKRVGNAERQKRFRDRRKAGKQVRNDSNALRDVTPPIEEYHTPKQSSPSGEACSAKRPKSVPMHSLPVEWFPVLTAASQRLVDGWPPGKLDREVCAFRDHAADKGRKSRDWQAAFRKWIDNADKWMPRNDRPSPSNDHEPANPYARAVLARQAERAGHGNGQPDSWT